VGNHPHFSKFVDIDQLDSYSLAGHLIGWTNGTSTMYDLTDGQGSVLMSLSASAVQGDQICWHVTME
jgi:hypothetical protein